MLNWYLGARIDFKFFCYMWLSVEKEKMGEK